MYRLCVSCVIIGFACAHMPYHGVRCRHAHLVVNDTRVHACVHIWRMWFYDPPLFPMRQRTTLITSWWLEIAMALQQHMIWHFSNSEEVDEVVVQEDALCLFNVRK